MLAVINLLTSNWFGQALIIAAGVFMGNAVWGIIRGATSGERVLLARLVRITDHIARAIDRIAEQDQTTGKDQ